MPAGKAEANAKGTAPSGGATGAAARTSFRPPWVRDGPNPLPMPQAPWTLNKRGSVVKEMEVEAPPSRKSSTVKIVPVQSSENGTSSKDPHTFEIPKLREVPKPAPKEQTKLQSREVKVPVALNPTRRDSKDLPVKVHIDGKKKDEGIHKVELKPVNKERRNVQMDEEDTKKDEKIHKVELKPVNKERRSVQIDGEDAKNMALDKAMPSERNAIVRQESMKKLCPAPPPMPPPPPPPEMPFNKRDSLTRSQLEHLDSLRSRPRKRPDWGAMMKDIEGGKKLKKVQCNDRSQPLLPQTTAKGQFIYESEKANLHNQLLKQIQTGSRLKHVKTNDRSKPILEGLRKFRRQMTIEEQIQKSQSMAHMPEAEVEEEADEMDDIDKVRDDLQSTKQMLALELRNKEAQIRENKRLQARLANLEAEIEKLRNQGSSDDTESPAREMQTAQVDDKLVKTLKTEAEEAKKTAEEMDKKYHDTADQLDLAKNELDDAKKQNMLLEKKLQQALQGAGQKRQSIDRRESVPGKEVPEEDLTEEEPESESEEEGISNEEKQQRRAEREMRLIRNKLKSYKNKQEAAKRERKNLRDQMKKNQQAMKEEKKKYKSLQKEVNKMAALMKDDEEEEEEEEEEESETEEEESETESESESSEEEESSESEDEDATLEEKKDTLQARVKRHENCLNALKKGNYMLKANVDRLQDDLNKQKEMVVSLQEDLDSVLSELG